jgi:hypothetical protein
LWFIMQKRADIIYIVVEAWNHEKINFAIDS